MSSLHCLHYWLAETKRSVECLLAQTSWQPTKDNGYNFQRPVRKVAPVPTISKFAFDHHTHQYHNIHTLLANVLSITWLPIWIRLSCKYPLTIIDSSSPVISGTLHSTAAQSQDLSKSQFVADSLSSNHWSRYLPIRPHILLLFLRLERNTHTKGGHFLLLDFFDRRTIV